MADLSVFTPDVGDDNGKITTPITPTKKGKRKLGGTLATTQKGDLSVAPDNVQVIEYIERQYGAGFVHLIYERLQREEQSRAEVFNDNLAAEEIVTLARIRNVENAQKLARERIDTAFKLEQLQKLKSEAANFMVASNFEKMVDLWHLKGCKPHEIVAILKKDAAKLNIQLIGFEITSDGYDIPEWEFTHEDKITACKNRLAELGVSLEKLKEMGIEVE